MPNLWLFNMDEEIYGADRQDAAQVRRYARTVHSRNLFDLTAGDLAVFAGPLDDDFVEYGSVFTKSRVCTIPHLSDGPNGDGLLTESMLGNSVYLEELRRLCASAGFTIRPYVQTLNALQLAQMIGVTWDGTSREHIEQDAVWRANSKSFMKGVAFTAGLRVAPYLEASNLRELLHSIDQFGAQHRNALFLKKDTMCGGMGNLSGDIHQLRQLAPQWYRSGKVLLEPHLSVRASLGSFVVIHQEHIDFLGVDEQFFSGYKWAGFRYPYHDTTIVAEIRRFSLQMGTQLRQLGLRGPANFDWLVIGENYPEADLREGDIIFSECNFRLTGVHPVLNFGRRFFRHRNQQIKALSYTQFPLAPQYSPFAALYARLSRIHVRGQPLLCRLNSAYPQSGALISRAPADNTCGITFFAHDDRELNEYADIARAALA